MAQLDLNQLHFASHGVLRQVALSVKRLFTVLLMPYAKIFESRKTSELPRLTDMKLSRL